MRALWFSCATLWPLLAGVMHAERAQAQSDDERLRLMSETVAYTDVIDAFDGDDRFDLNVQLAYVRLRETGDVYRERTVDGQRTSVQVARARRDMSQLALGLDVGLFRDVMVFARMPLVLSDERTLSAPGGASADAIAAQLRDDGDPQALFAVPFSAPTRAGLDYVAFGGAIAVVNQMRRPHLPTWVLRVEGRRPVGDVMRACRRTDAELVCGVSYVDESGVQQGTRTTRDQRGSSDGLAALLLETRFSRRFRHAEPYGGLSFLVRWPAQARRASHQARFPAGERGRSARPGPESGGTLGVAFIPWENRAAYHRFAFDLRLDATYVATGHGYSALFDALGTSDNAALAAPRTRCVDGGGCARDDFAGVTEIGSHLRYGGQMGVEVQAARYVRFALGASLRWVTAHALTGQAPCRAGGAGEVGDDGRACTGSVDLAHRGVIDAPGRRFFLRDELMLGAYAQAAAMF